MTANSVNLRFSPPDFNFLYGWILQAQEDQRKLSKSKKDQKKPKSKKRHPPFNALSKAFQRSSSQSSIVAMSEPKLSNRARKKLQKQGESPAGARSESGASDVPKKDDVIATFDTPSGDSIFKPREGPNPYIDVVQKKIRNLTKRRVSFSYPRPLLNT